MWVVTSDHRGPFPCDVCEAQARIDIATTEHPPVHVKNVKVSIVLADGQRLDMCEEHAKKAYAGLGGLL